MDDDNDPAPENAQPSASATHTIGKWVTPTICTRRVDVIVLMTVVADHQDPERERTTALRESVADAAPNVGGLLQEIA